MRVWLSGNASLTEIKTEWSLTDLADANEALDIKDEYEGKSAERARAKK